MNEKTKKKIIINHKLQNITAILDFLEHGGTLIYTCGSPSYPEVFTNMTDYFEIIDHYKASSSGNESLDEFALRYTRKALGEAGRIYGIDPELLQMDDEYNFPDTDVLIRTCKKIKRCYEKIANEER